MKYQDVEKYVGDFFFLPLAASSRYYLFFFQDHYAKELRTDFFGKQESNPRPKQGAWVSGWVEEKET